MNFSLKEWIEDSHFVDENGAPIRLFHGTDIDEPFNIFARSDEASLGYHFGSVGAANDRLEQIFRMVEGVEGSIIPVYCRAKKPLLMNDLYTWSQMDVAHALRDVGVIGEDEVEFIEDSSSSALIFAAIEEAGFDCVLYANVCEAADLGEESLMIWRASLVKGIHSEYFVLDDPRLLSQVAASEDDLGNWESVEAEIDAARADLREFRQRAKPTMA